MKNIKENTFDTGIAGGGSINSQPSLGTHSSPNVSQNPSSFSNVNNKPIPNDASSSEDIENDIKKIYSKKKIPTSDDVKSGLDYELHNMVPRDLQKAKRKVLDNLKRDPDYYKNLGQLNIDDEKMTDKVDVNEVRKIFKETLEKRDTKYVVNKEISDIMKNMWNRRHSK